MNQYKRYHPKLKLIQGLVVFLYKNSMATLVPFRLIVEIVHQTHMQLAHIGSLKLIDIVSRQFWHPAIRKVALDICRSCPHCQVYKVSKQDRKPPIIKIKTRYPFELLSIDLMMLQRTPRQNIVVLLTIDHYSIFIELVSRHPLDIRMNTFYSHHDMINIIMCNN